jgi:hypothetical protein
VGAAEVIAELPFLGRNLMHDAHTAVLRPDAAAIRLSISPPPVRR